MKVVLDTSAIIYLNDFRKFDEMFTVQDVIEEVKDNISSMKISSLNLKIVEPDRKFLKKIESSARETGDFEELSETDKKILAIALQENAMIVSDDRSVQNVAEKFGLKYISVFSEKIKKLVIWKKYCKNCKKFFETDNCPVCGEKLIRKRESFSEIK
jgi:UPF0271 protein